jgi:hypothetical protein
MFYLVPYTLLYILCNANYILSTKISEKIAKIFRSSSVGRISPILLEEWAFACKIIENLAVMGFSAR